MTEKKKRLNLNGLKDEIEELKKGLMEIAHEVGKNKGRIDAHTLTPDAHNPGHISRAKDAI